MTDLPDESSGNLIRSSRWNTLLAKIEEGTDTDVRIRGRHASFGTFVILTTGSFASVYAPILTGTVRGRTITFGSTISLTWASFATAWLGTSHGRIVSAGTVVGLSSGSFGTISLPANLRVRILTAGTVVALTSGSFASDAARTSQMEIFDDFVGTTFTPTWATTITEGGRVVINDTGSSDGSGQVRLKTSTTLGSDARLYAASRNIPNSTSQNPLFEARIYPSVSTQINYTVGLVLNDHDPTAVPAAANDHAIFHISAGASAASTLCSTAGAGVQSSLSTINNTSGAWVKYRIALDGSNAYFYIDDVLRATKNTNLPGLSVNLRPFVGIDAPVSIASRNVSVDYIYVRQNRID